MIQVVIENFSTLEKREAFLEAIYYNYLILNIPNEYQEERLIIDIYDQEYNLILENQVEFNNLIECVKKQNFDISKIEICNCFRGLFCIDCLFVKTNKLKIKKDLIIFSHKIEVTSEISKKNYSDEVLGPFADIVTYTLPLTNEVSEDLVLDTLPVKETLKRYPLFYSKVLFHYSKSISRFDLKDFFNLYYVSTNLDLYLLNEALLNILVRSDQDFLNSFFIYLGEFSKKIKASPNFFKLLIGLFHISRFRVVEILITYDLLNTMEVRDSISALYYYKLYRMIDKEIIKRYKVDIKDLKMYEFYH